MRARFLEGRPFPLRKALDYSMQIAQGLAAAHEKGIAHRDLKPENLFVTSEGRVKILDFGLAKLLSPSATSGEAPTAERHTQAGAVLGTVGYMSPEQVRGQPSDHRSDIFAFGAILHELLSGRRAFQRETDAEIMAAILKEDPPALRAAEAPIPPQLARIVERCLEKDPKARFQSTQDLGFALQGLATSSDAATPLIKSTRPWSRWLPWILAAAATLIAAFTVVIAYSRRGTEAIRAVQFQVVPPGRFSITGARASLRSHLMETISSSSPRRSRGLRCSGSGVSIRWWRSRSPGPKVPPTRSGRGTADSSDSSPLGSSGRSR